MYFRRSTSSLICAWLALSACSSNDWVGKLTEAVTTGAALKVFVTSLVTVGDMSGFDSTSIPGGSCASHNGVAKADCACQGLGQTAGIFDFERFRAWLQTGTDQAACHVVGLSGNTECTVAGTPGPYVKLAGDGLTIFNERDDFYINHIDPLTNIDVDENGATVADTTKVWTGVEQNGTATTGNCTDWTATVGTGGAGSVSTTSTWTYQAPEEACSTTRAVYCFQIPTSISENL